MKRFAPALVSHTAGLLGLSLALLAAASCAGCGAAADLLDPAAVGVNLGDGSVRQINPPGTDRTQNGGGAQAGAIPDGTSNTVQIGEQPPSNTTATAIANLTTAMGDKFFEFGSSSGNSGNDAFVTGITQLELCAFGRFAMRETTSFTSSVGDFSSEHVSNGTWSVRVTAGGFALLLNIENSDDRNAPPSKQFSLQIDAQRGTIAFDGSTADVNDAAADCAQNAPTSRP